MKALNDEKDVNSTMQSRRRMKKRKEESKEKIEKKNINTNEKNLIEKMAKPKNACIIIHNVMAMAMAMVMVMVTVLTPLIEMVTFNSVHKLLLLVLI